MPVYMVDRELPGVTMDQLGAARKAAIETGQRFTEAGKNVRYIRTTFCARRSALYVPFRGR